MEYIYAETISTEMFKYCIALQAIDIPPSVKTIGSGAFSHCNSLSEVLIPDTVKELGPCVFSEDPNLKHVRLPEDIDCSELTFSGCFAITTVKLGSFELNKDNLSADDPKHLFQNEVSIFIEMFSTLIHESKSYPQSISAQERQMVAIKIYNVTKQPEALAYIKRNSASIIKTAIDEDNYDVIKFIIDNNLISKTNAQNYINLCIKHLAENPSNHKAIEIQTLLNRYKNQQFGSKTSNMRL